MSERKWTSDVARSAKLVARLRASGVIQAYGAAGVREDTPLAASSAPTPKLRFAEGAEEIHHNQAGKHELAQHD